MPKQKSSQLSRMWLYVFELAADVFSTDDLVLYCKVYDVKIAKDQKFSSIKYAIMNKHLHGCSEIK